MILNNYIVQTTREAGRWIARFSKETAYDQREGAAYKLLGLGVADTEEDAIYDAIQKALYTNV